MDSGTVLVVDDEVLFCKGVCDALTEVGIPVMQAEDGERALHLLTKHRIALMITDLKMPVMDGFQLLTTMLSRRLRVPTIVLTAFGTPEMHARVLASGAIAYMDKPVDIDNLVAHVQKQLTNLTIGHVEGVTLPSLLQLVELERKTCILYITNASGKFGVLGFHNGVLSFAKYGARVGNEAAKRIAQWSDVSVDIDPRMPEIHNVDTSLVSILMESMVEADESGRSTIPGSTGPSWAPPSIFGLEKKVSVPRGAHGVTDHDSAEPPKTTKEQAMANVGQSLEALLTIDGAIGAALVDWKSGLTLGTVGGMGRLDIELAATANTQVVRAKMGAMETLGISGGITDILITLDDQIHIIRPLKKYPELFIYLAVDKTKGNLGLARAKVTAIEGTLAL